MNVNGNSESARTLGDDVVRCAGQVINATGEIDGALKRLGSSFKDEQYSEISGAIQKIQKATLDILPTLQAVKPKLDQYASILDRARLKL